MNQIEKTCIVCPKGCRLVVEVIDEKGGKVRVSGNQCKRGELFAAEEITHPVRTLQTTVATIFDERRRLPVKTSDTIPKGRMFDVIKEAQKVVIEQPVKAGDVILENVSGTGINLIATADISSRYTHL